MVDLGLKEWSELWFASFVDLFAGQKPCMDLTVLDDFKNYWQSTLQRVGV